MNNEIADKLVDLELRLERAACILDRNLAEDYFSEKLGTDFKEESAFLLSGYDSAGIAVDVVQDYIFQCQEIVKNLQEEMQKEK